MTEVRLADDVSVIKGIGSVKKERLHAMGIESVGDLIAHLPVRYRDRRSVTGSGRTVEGRDFLVAGTLVAKHTRRISGKRSILECVLRDEDGIFNAVFFNMPYLDTVLKNGVRYVIFGRMKWRNGIKIFTNPEIEQEGSDRDVRGLVPVYRCTSGITSRDFAKWIDTAVECSPQLKKEWIDERIVESGRMCDEYYAYRNIHFPADEHRYNVARYRMIFQELLIYLLAVRMNSEYLSDTDLDASVRDVDPAPFIDALPFEYTCGQQAAVDDIMKDLVSRRPMNRLLQGDVGCGKTAVAAAAVYMVAKGSGQCAFMAPTEILAGQHYAKLTEMFAPFGLKTALLTSGMKASDRKKTVSEISSGKISIVIGTHALISEDVDFNDLRLIITDEQHRFGVNQRKALADKASKAVNVLVMSATPIPRTLATTVFGDMDFSIIRTKPENRKKIITRALTRGSREIAYKAVKEQIESGHQAYIVAPSIDEDEENDMVSVEEIFAEVKKKFRGFRAALLHGRMNADDKRNVMADFASGNIDILVSTVVIEVGIDVPGATVIVIENSERFGLAQLHQLRGRVGRCEMQSYCYLVNYSNSENAQKRMKVMTELSDGFEISEEDYRLRGPGDIAGTMQHGTYGSRMSEYFRYTKILDAASSAADIILRGEAGQTDMDEVRRRIAGIGSTDNSSVI